MKALSARPRRKKPTPKVNDEFSLQAPLGGVNALDPLMGMPALDCIYTFNLMPSESTLLLRKGYREWANGLGGAVRTMITFEGQAADQGNDRMWAVTAAGIHDVTLDNTMNPPAVVAFVDQTENAGFGVFTEFTSDAAERYLQYADAKNGLHQYSETTDLWDVPVITPAAGETTPFDVADVAFVTTWKNRFWYIQEDTSDAWYLPPDSNAGEVSKFTFGSKFTHGGNLMGLWSWTIDGGDGVDDYLVAVSRGGDVLVYRGSDPTQPDFGLVGSYFIGEVPESRRIAVEYGGDLYLLSIYGLTSVRELLKGVDTLKEGTGPAAKISPLLRRAVQAGKDEYTWSLHTNPSDGFLQIIAPFEVDSLALQYQQNLLTTGWGFWRGVPINCAEQWSGEYYFGTKNGQVFLYDGTLDGTLLDGTQGVPIEFETLSSFQAGNNHALYKRVGFLRPIGFVAGQTSLNIRAIYDYDIDPSLAVPPNLPVVGDTVWDTAIWDADIWDAGGVSSASIPFGADGIGRTVAVAMRGSATTRISLIGWDGLYQQGGFL